MIVFGSNKTVLNEKIINGYSCESCNSLNSVSANIMGKYGHFFWIPYFAMGKKGTTVCLHCKHLLTEKEMQPSLLRKVKEIKSLTKIPIWYFSGIILTIIVSTICFINDNANSKNTEIYLANPKMEDVYEQKLGFLEFSTMKISAITTDSIFFYLNDYTVNRSRKLYKIDKDKKYNYDYQLGYSKKELLQMKLDGEILEVNRD